MNDDTAVAYLRRLGVEREPPSAEALFRLHRAHVERVPYETVWLHLGEPWDTDVAQSVERIAHRGRGGYCFHLNGALSALLLELGYDVVRHVGGVHGPDGPSALLLTNHLVLTVHNLPSDDNPAGVWYVDAGLGDALYDPLPLRPGTYEQRPWTLTLERSDGAVGDWHLTHDPAGGFSGMEWRSAPATMDAFASRHVWLSTAPESGFVQVMTAQTRDATGVTVLRGLVLKRIGEGATESTIESRAELEGVLRETFALNLDAVASEAMDALWAKLSHAHERWSASPN